MSHRERVTCGVFVGGGPDRREDWEERSILPRIIQKIKPEATLMAFQEGCWGWGTEPRWIHILRREHPLRQGNPTGPDWGLPCPVWNRGSLHLLRDIGNSMASLFIGLGQSSVTDSLFRDWPWLHNVPFLPSRNNPCPVFPSSSWAWPAATVPVPAWRGKEVSYSPKGELNTHCALEVPKSPSAGGVYVSSLKSFDLAKPHAIPKAQHSETLLVQSQQNPNKCPDFLTIWALPSSDTTFSLSLCSSGNSELWFEVTSKERQSDVW